MMINILSLGAGVQSTAVLLMSVEGLLPKFDYAIFSDTGWEPLRVYRHLEWLRGVAEESGIPLIVCNKRNIKDDILAVTKDKNSVKGYGCMPMHLLKEDGTKGMLRRQCTGKYKIEPLERFVKTEILGLKIKGHWPKEQAAKMWFGISSDEVIRMRNPDRPWKSHCYPLCDIESFHSGRVRGMDLPMFNREACLRWMEEHEYPVPARSACIGCPFHSNVEWRDMRDNHPEDWKDAIRMDKIIREWPYLRATPFLHPDCVDLDKVDLSPKENERQTTLWSNECLGMCGV